MDTPSHPEIELPAGLSNPARSALAVIGITRLDQIPPHSAAEILKLHGMGPKGIRILREALIAHGLAFKGE